MTNWVKENTFQLGGAVIVFMDVARFSTVFLGLIKKYVIPLNTYVFTH